MIPGSNLLRKAFRLIAKQQLIYYQAIGRTFNVVGQYITQYAPGTVIYGSFQPVARQEYERLGLDFQKTYYNLYIPKSLVDINRNVSPDQISFQDQRFTCESSTPWYGADGWIAVLCVMVSVDAAAPSIFGFNATLTFPMLENTYTNFLGGNFMQTPQTGVPVNDR